MGLKVPGFQTWLGFVVTGPHPGAHGNKRSHHPANAEGFRSSVSDAPMTQEISKGLRSSVPGTPGRDGYINNFTATYHRD